MRIAQSDVENVNNQINGFNIELTNDNIGNIVKGAIEYRKNNVWGDYCGEEWHLPFEKELIKFSKYYRDHNNLRVAILVDVDVDGYMSSSIIYEALKSMNKNNDVIPVFPDAKLHGIKANEKLFDGEKYNWIICPDSSSNDLVTINKIQSKGTKVMVIDHHILENEEFITENYPNYMVVSNQYQDGELNKELTGSGMAAQVAKLWLGSDKIPYPDLTAIGQIADMSDLNDASIMKIVSYGMENISNKMLKSFFKDDPEKMTIKHIQFSLIPKINAVARIGGHEERELTFNALVGIGKTEMVKKRRKLSDGKMHSVDIEMNVYDRAADMLQKVKSRQDRLVKKALKEIKMLSNEECQYNIAILPEKYDKGIAGLVANKMLGNTKKPTLVLKEKGNVLQGSGRFPGNINGMSLLKKLDGVKFAAGHEQAFGVALYDDKWNDVASKIEEYSESVPDYEYYVDAGFVDELPTVDDIAEIYRSANIFRGARDEIKIAVIGLKVPKKDIKLVNNWMSIKMSGITIDDFNATDELKKYIKSGFSDKTISFVCSSGFNYWGKSPVPQLIIDKCVKSDEVKIKQTADNFIF